MFDLEALFRAANSAMPVRGHTPPGFDTPTRYVPQSIQQIGALNLDEQLPNIAIHFDDEGRLLRTPRARENVQSVVMDPMVVVGANSRVAAAGAFVLLREPSVPAKPTGATGLVVMREEVAGLSVIRPLKLQTLPDGADLPVTSGLPVATAQADWATAKAYGAHLRLTRDDMRKARAEGRIAEILTAAVVSGVGRVADQVLLAALEASSLGTFSLAAAAAQGLEFSSLRGIAGTAAHGAGIGADGVLRVAGVAAELSDACTASFVGAFGNAGVILDREVRIVAERTDIEGAMSLTVFASAVPLIADPTKFWAVAA
ncbi:hypothetical protein [Xanthomonas sacchari]|uniref:hypothetical protein n=1 Tax=Xanthomonas sacchari TaxID=56458 RepID=UPI003B21A234